MYTFGGEDEKMVSDGKEGIDHAYTPCKRFEFHLRAMGFTKGVSEV